MSNRWAQATKATKKKAKLRMTLQGAAGCGKTYSALRIAEALVNLDGDGKHAYVVDTEFGSANKYAHLFDFNVITWGQDKYDPRELIEMFRSVPEDCGVIVIDSATHFWKSTGGFLEMVEEVAKRNAARGGRVDTYAAWKEVDKIYNRFVDAMLSCPCHVIMTMRAKAEYERKQDEKTGKTKLEKVGMAPEMRDGFNYVPDIEGILDQDHCMMIGKTRVSDVDGRVFDKPGEEFVAIVHKWLTTGKDDDSVNKPVAKKPEHEPKRAVIEPVDADVVPDAAAEAEAAKPDMSDPVVSFSHLIYACRSTTDLDEIARDIKRASLAEDQRKELLGVWSARRREVKEASQ